MNSRKEMERLLPLAVAEELGALADGVESFIRNNRENRTLRAVQARLEKDARFFRDAADSLGERAISDMDEMKGALAAIERYSPLASALARASAVAVAVGDGELAASVRFLEKVFRESDLALGEGNRHDGSRMLRVDMQFIGAVTGRPNGHERG